MRRCTIKIVLDLVQAIESPTVASPETSAFRPRARSRLRIEGRLSPRRLTKPEFGHLSTKRLMLLQYTIGLFAIERQLDRRTLRRPRIGICCSRGAAGF